MWIMVINSTPTAIKIALDKDSSFFSSFIEKLTDIHHCISLGCTV